MFLHVNGEAQGADRKVRWWHASVSDAHPGSGIAPGEGSRDPGRLAPVDGGGIRNRFDTEVTPAFHIPISRRTYGSRFNSPPTQGGSAIDMGLARFRAPITKS